jgi:RimJ/RimL family protein N-acetyltransferase
MAAMNATFPDPAAGRLPLPVLQGERCLLRALVPGDAVSLQRHADNARVWRNLFEGFPHPYTLAEAEAWCSRDAHSGAFGYVWGVVVDGAAIGCIGLAPQDGWLRCNAEAGYWIGESWWGRGTAADALRQVTDWAFAALPGLTRIFAPIFAWNEASQAVARKSGYACEGQMPRSAIKDGRVIDRVVWAAYRPDTPPRPADIRAALAAAPGAPPSTGGPPSAH